MHGHLRRLLLPGALIGLLCLVAVLRWGGRGQSVDGLPGGLEPDGPPVETSSASGDVSPVDEALPLPSAAVQRVEAGPEAPGAGLVAQTVEVTGRVLGQPFGRPVEDALVVLRDAFGEATTRTAGDGSFALAWARVSPGLLVEHPGFVDARRPLEDLTEPVEVSLQPSGSLVGRVIAVAGPLPAGASVHLWTEVRGKRSEEPVHAAEIEPTGRYSMPDVAPGTYALGLVEPGVPVVVQAGILIEAGQITYADLELPPSAEVRGVVLLGGSRLPVEGATVRAQPEVQGLGNDMEKRASFDSLTEPDGTFHLVGVPTGQVDLWLRAPWGHRQRGETQAIAGKEPKPFRFVIAAPAKLSGRVIDSAGNPVSGAWVVRCLADEAGQLPLGRPAKLDLGDERLHSTVADASGRFDLGLVPGRQQFMLRAYAPGPDGGWMVQGTEVPALETLSLAPDSETTDLELVLRRGWPVTGVVRDIEGQPLAGVTLEPRVRIGRSWAELDGVSTDAEGRFRLFGVPEGAASLATRHDDYQRERLRIDVVEGLEELEFELAPAFALQGVVLDAAGYAIPGARAAARLEDSEAKRRRSTSVDEFGRFVLDGLEEGAWTVTASAPGWEHPSEDAQRVLLPGAPELRLTLQPVPAPALGSVTGELRRAGSGDPIPGLRFNQTRRGTVEKVGTRFHIRGMMPGRIKLVATGDKVEPYPFPTIDLRPGAQLDLGSVELRGVTDIVVRVLGPAGKPRSKSKVWFERLPVERGGRPFGSSKLRAEYVKEGEAFRLRALPRYRWALQVRADGCQPYTKEIRAHGTHRAFEVALQARKKRR